MPNRVEIGQTVAEIQQLMIFKDGGRSPSWICGARICTFYTDSTWWSLSLCKIWLESVE